MSESSVPNNFPPLAFPDSVRSGLQGSKWLASWWLAAVGSTGLAMAAARLLSVHRRIAGDRRQPVAMRQSALPGMGGVVSRLAGVLALLTVAGAILANAYASYIPNPKAARRLLIAATGLRAGFSGPVSTGDALQGDVSMIHLPGDPSLSVPGSNAWVYTPPDYDDTGATRYPILYLIHGYPGTAADWFVAGEADRILDVLLAGRLVKPMIVVSLDINGGWQRDTGCLDAVDGPQMESWLYARVLPFVEKAYPTDSTQESRMLGGVSAGGYCALDQGLRHQDTWGTILCFEGYGDPGRGGRIAFRGDTAAIKAHSPSSYLPTISFEHAQAFYLDSGDRLGLARVKKLANLLAERNRTLYHRINQGEGHSWSEVRAGLPYALVFASRQLQKHVR